MPRIYVSNNVEIECTSNSVVLHFSDGTSAVVDICLLWDHLKYALSRSSCTSPGVLRRKFEATKATEATTEYIMERSK